MTEEKEEGFDKVKEGFKKVVGGSAEVVEGSAQEIKEAVEDTGEEVDETVREATDSDTHTKSYDQSENREYDKAVGKDPMDPEDIAKHEPTAVKRDKNHGSSGDPV